MEADCRGHLSLTSSSCPKARPVQGWAFASSSTASATKTTTKNQGWAFGPTTPASPGTAAPNTGTVARVLRVDV